MGMKTLTVFTSLACSQRLNYLNWAPHQGWIGSWWDEGPSNPKINPNLGGGCHPRTTQCLTLIATLRRLDGTTVGVLIHPSLDTGIFSIIPALYKVFIVPSELRSPTAACSPLGFRLPTPSPMNFRYIFISKENKMNMLNPVEIGSPCITHLTLKG